MRRAPTCFGFPNTVLLCTVHYTHTPIGVGPLNHDIIYVILIVLTVQRLKRQLFITDWINMQPLDRTDSVNNVF